MAIQVIGETTLTADGINALTQAQASGIDIQPKFYRCVSEEILLDPTLNATDINGWYTHDINYYHAVDVDTVEFVIDVPAIEATDYLKMVGIFLEDGTLYALAKPVHAMPPGIRQRFKIQIQASGQSDTMDFKYIEFDKQDTMRSVTSIDDLNAQLVLDGYKIAYVPKYGTYIYDPNKKDIIDSFKIVNGWILDSTDTSETNLGLAILTPGNKKTLAIIGDSKSHGYFIGETYNASWAGILRKDIQELYHQHDYGFETLFDDNGNWEQIHKATTTGLFSTPSQGQTQAPNGMAYATNQVGAKISIAVPVISSYFLIGYTTTKQFEAKVYINGAESKTIYGDTNYTLENLSMEDGYKYNNGLGTGYFMQDDGTGKCNIEIELVSGEMEIFGIKYLNNNTILSLDNYSQSGRTLRGIPHQTITGILEESAAIIFALGENDDLVGDADQQIVKSKIDFFISENKRLYNKPVMILDFLEGQPFNHWLKSEYRRMHKELKNSILIDFGHILSLGNNGLFNEGLTAYSNLFRSGDNTHYNIHGHKWVAEIIRSKLGISKNSGWKWIDDKIKFSYRAYWSYPNSLLEVIAPADKFIIPGFIADQKGGQTIGFDTSTSTATAQRNGEYMFSIDLVYFSNTASDEGTLSFEVLTPEDETVGYYHERYFNSGSSGEENRLEFSGIMTLNAGYSVRPVIRNIDSIKLRQATFTGRFVEDTSEYAIGV